MVVVLTCVDRELRALLLGFVLVGSSFALSGSAAWGLPAETRAPGTSEPAEPDAVQLEIVTAGSPGPEHAQVSVETDGPQEGSPPVRTVHLVDGAASVELPFPETRNGLVRVTAPGHWSAPIRIDEPVESARSEDRSYRVTLWPAAVLQGTLILPEDVEPPPAARLRLIPTRDVRTSSRTQPSGVTELSCPVAERKLLDCTVPAGRWNIRLSVAPLAPHFLWDRAPKAGKSLDLGKLELVHGGSVFGLMTLERGVPDPDRARVWLRPLAEDAGHDLETKLRQLTRFGSVQPDGAFEVVGAPPGEYELGASHPGFVTARRRPVTVEDGRWTELREPVLLELPIRLSLLVEPGAEPFGGPWALRLYRQESGGAIRAIGGGDADESGSWQSPPIPPGSYVVQVLDGEEDTLVWRELEVDRSTGVTRIEIPLVYVEAEVVLDGQPLEATVWFGGRTGSEVVEVESDASGELVAALPRDGTWTVDVAAETPTVRSRGLEVEIEPVEGLDLAEVRIRVPDTSVDGQLVDELERPAKVRARIHLVPLDGEAKVTGIETDADGVFEIRGLPPGRYRVGAETADASSDVVEVELQEALSTSVRLTLRREETITGAVLSDAGPVPGVEVRALPLTGTGRLAAMKIDSARSNLDGSFELAVPAGSEAARLTAMAPGYAFAIERVSEWSGVEILLHRQGGTLVLEGVGEAVRTLEGSELGIVLINGQAVDLATLRKWSRLQEAVLTEEGTLPVPSMPPGDYALCRLGYEEAVLVMDGAALPSAEACTEGFLPPGGTLRLIDPT